MPENSGNSVWVQDLGFRVRPENSVRAVVRALIVAKGNTAFRGFGLQIVGCRLESEKVFRAGWIEACVGTRPQSNASKVSKGWTENVRMW